MERTWIIVLMAALAAAPALAWAAEEAAPLEELLSEVADTPEEHRALADHFRRTAESARAEAAVHRRMGRATGALGVGLAIQMKVHCNRISDLQATLAKEYEGLANLHAAEAKRLKAAKP